MGCGASNPSTGRETNETQKAQESFFPPVVTPQKTSTVPEQQKHTSGTPSSLKAAAATTTPLATAVVSPSRKPKTTYIPPSPIDSSSDQANQKAAKQAPTPTNTNTTPIPALEPLLSTTTSSKTSSPAKQRQGTNPSSPLKEKGVVPPTLSAYLPPPPPPPSSSDDAPDSRSLGLNELVVDESTTTEGDNELDGSIGIGEALLPLTTSEKGGSSLQQGLDVGSDTLDPEAIVSSTAGMDFGNNKAEPAAAAAPPAAAAVAVKIPVTCRINNDATPEPSSLSGMRFDELYRLKGVLGTGAFSTVRAGFHRSNLDKSYAVKCINRKKLSEEDEAALLDEVAILKEMTHAHIIRLFDFFAEPSTYYLVMERMRGGELFDRIVAKAYYNEKEARDTCKIVLQAVGYFHDNHVAHRDLKPENLLLLSEDDDSAVKIADFGFAKKVYKPNSLKTQCGTPGYVAPEILEGTPYDERADMWSVGVILYILLGGYPPFIESTQRDLFRKIRKGEYEFHEEYWGTVSAEAKGLISSLLTVDASKRLTAEDALENEWILGDDAKLANRDLGGNLEKLRNFNAKRKFRAAVATIMAVNKLNWLGASFFKTLKSNASSDDEAEDHDLENEN